MNLTPQEQKFIGCLQAVDPDTIWGLGIQIALREPTEEKVRSLIGQLQSQERDNPEIMREILNEDCYQTLLSL